MKYWIKGVIGSLAITSSAAYAKSFSLSPGVSIANSTESEELSREGNKLFEGKLAPGFNLEAELKLYKRISLVVAGQWMGGEATTQYDYTNPQNILEHAVMPDMESNYSIISGNLGLRLRFIDHKNVSAFMGYQYVKGKMILSHDENKFIYDHYSTLGFEDKEEVDLSGSALEVGVELFPNDSNKLQVILRKNRVHTEKFKTLGDRKISFENYQLLILYRHLF